MNAVSWIELDLLTNAQTGEWPDAARPISFGSMLKPFLTLAFAVTHSKFPTVVCRGSRDRCWFARGHGSQDIVAALANSCNCYFLHLVLEVDRAALDSVSLSYGLTLPSRSLDPAALIGLGQGWLNQPLAVARAFARVSDPTVLRGMSRCAQIGTAKNLRINCFAKTGTGPCSHSPRAAGDGFVVVMYPTGQPRTILLLRHHGTTGAEACRDVRQRISFR